MKLFILGMHAGIVGTDDTFYLVCDERPDDHLTWEYACEHAESYGNELDEDEEWSMGSEPECWVKAEVKTLEDLEEHLGYLLYGSMQEEELIAQIEKEGFKFA